MQGNIRPVAEEVADIARRLQRAKHSVQQISEITGLDPTVVESGKHELSWKPSQLGGEVEMVFLVGWWFVVVVWRWLCILDK